MTTTDAIHQAAIMIRGRGVGFVTLPDREDDIMIPPEATGVALDSDIVEIELDPPKAGERQTGRVLRVIERARSEYVGVVEERSGTYRLNPDNRRIHKQFILPDATAAHVGMKVAVALTAWDDHAADPAGSIIDVLGKAGDHETEMRAIIRSGGFATDFPPEVDDAARALHENRAQIFADAIADPKRRDFRGITTCTIDPHDAKDFDDALSFQKLDNGNYEIGIHIADVSHYVREGDAIDAEAQERGTSIYLVDRVIPMLPEILSNDLCSLRPHEDRLAFSAVFEMNDAAEIVNEWYGQTIIHSDHRFSYEEAQHVIDTGNGPLVEELQTLMRMSRILRKERHDRGAIAFEQPEVKFELDDNGKPIRIYIKERTETMLMIEDFMLLANRKVPEHIQALTKSNGHEIAFVYRVHDAPNPEKIEALSIFLHALGYEFRSNNGIVETKDINTLLKEVEGKPEETLIKTATIRSMAKAIYTTKNIGHFGLAFKFYTHFTSPIRRYPDLMVHRLMRRQLDGERIDSKDRARYEKLSIQSSEREGQAVTAERDSIKFKQVEYMSDKIGQEFDGVVSGVTEWGIYVEDKASKCEGMVKLSAMKGDYFTYDAKNYRVKGDRTGKVYQLGDEVRIKLVAANLHDRQLDFVLA